LDAKAYEKKQKDVSIVSSNKENCDLHRFRIDVARRCKKEGIADTFGTFDGGTYSDISESLKEYRYSIIVENTISDYFFCEKITNCFAAQTIPIYLGARKIDEFFNADGIIHIEMKDLNEIENIMIDFVNREYDILLCTTIIETGIDIPNANTLIIYDADRFGLSQLYQIRGRVGRSNRIAYCYLMYNERKILSNVAEKRLKAIKEFTELGSGFSIAMRDLSIRGAGDILGSEQAGFIDSVGIDMFLKMLEEEINRLKGVEVFFNEDETQPLVDVSTSISDQYVFDDELKIYIHQKINKINSVESMEILKSELEDRFGKLDQNMLIYMYEELFEKKAKKLNIKDVRQMKNFVEIWLPIDLTNSIKGDDLFIEVMRLSRMFRFSMKSKRLVIILDTVKLDKHFIYYLYDLLNVIEKCKK